MLLTGFSEHIEHDYISHIWEYHTDNNMLVKRKISYMIDIVQMRENDYGGKAPLLGRRAKRFLKAELARADVGYRELAERLKKHGLKETEASIANKISRGTFSATFLLASLKAIEADNLRLDSI